MRIFSKNKIAFLLPIAAFWLAACQTPATNVNVNLTNAPTGNTNVNSNFSNVNANLAPSNSTSSGVSIETSEPEKYQATVSLKFETGGSTEKSIATPSLTAQVAKLGSDKRMEFTMPSGEKVIYLDRGGRQLLISPNRKQYAELNKESTGFEVRRIMSPDQIVSRVKNLKGVERVGEEKYGGRDAVKYRYNSVTDTKSQAGNVATEAVIFVDKETNLPLRSETYSESQSGAGVSGVKSLRFVTEMTNLNTNVDAALFAEPTDYKKVAPEEVRSQVDAIFRVAVAFLGQMMNNQNNANTNANTNASPAATATVKP